MIPYLFKSILCLGILLLVYLLFLEKEKMHRFNRWYLLGSILFACFVPLVSFTVTQESLPVLQNNYLLLMDNSSLSISQQSFVQSISSDGTKIDLMFVLLGIYSVVTFILLVRFAKNIYSLLSNAARNKTIAYRGAHLVLLKEHTASYSFLNYIFISEQDYSNRAIEEELITHELTHVTQKHSWDVIFIELLQTIFWFNPMFLFYKKAIQLNHEYLADDAVIQTNTDVSAYQCLLLDKAVCSCNAHLTSSFNYSVTKKRLIMMTKKYNKVRSLLKKIALIPVLASALLFFSAKDMMAQEKKPEKIGAEKTKQKPPVVGEALGMGWTVPAGAGASEGELAAFNAIIDKNLAVTKNGHKILPHVEAAERAQMFDIFKHMDKSQRGEARAAFVRRPKPSPPKHPTQQQLEEWKNADVYGVWMGSKKIKNEELNKYKPEDIGSYWVSNLNYTEEMKQNVMKNFNLKKMYKYQLNLSTTADAEKEYKNALASPPEYLVFQINSVGKNKVMIPVN
jgi:bla regulator protein BlaR1